MNVTDEEAMRIAREANDVAVIGMTDGSKPGRASFEIPQRLQKAGIKVHPINPRIEAALGEKAVAAPADLDHVPDIYDVFRAPDAIPQVADELLALPEAHRKAVVWLQTGITHPEAEKKLEDAGFKVVSDRCLGVLVALSGR